MRTFYTSSSELTPEEILSFVTAFSDAKAAGVVGTETAIEQGLAGTAMEWFLSSLKQGRKLGEAMYQMRWRLLQKRNVMGLITPRTAPGTCACGGPHDPIEQ